MRWDSYGRRLEAIQRKENWEVVAVTLSLVLTWSTVLLITCVNDILVNNNLVLNRTSSYTLLPAALFEVARGVCEGESA